MKPFHEPLQLVFGADPTVPNPKVALLATLLEHARHGILLLSDSNVRLEPDDISRVLPAFDDPRVGMVYQPVVAVGERTVPAAIENLHYTEYAAFLTIGCRLLAGQHTVNAKGQWVRRAALADVDDFARVGDCGADDYELSRQVAQAGWQLRSAETPVQVVQREWSWSSLTSRNLRHAGLRWRICPWAYPLELVFNPIPWTLPLFAAGRHDLAALAIAVILAKTLLELSAARLLRGTPLAMRFAAIIYIAAGSWPSSRERRRGGAAAISCGPTAASSRSHLCRPPNRAYPAAPQPEAALVGRPRYNAGMKFRSLASGLCLFLVLAATATAAGPLRVGMELSYPPFEMTDPQGRPTGVSVRLADALAKHLGRPLVIENIAFDGLIPALKTGKIDCIISSMTATPERSRSIAFSDPYLKTGLALLIGTGSPVRSAADLNVKGRVIAVKKGTTGHQYAAVALKQARLLVLDKESSGVLEVVQGKADAFIYDSLSVYQNQKRHPDTTRALLAPFREETWAVGLRQDDLQLREQVNAFLKAFRAEGGFEKLGDEFLSEEKRAFDAQGLPFYF